MRGVSPATLLDHISNLPHARATFKQLVRELGAKGEERDELEAALERLVNGGDLIKVRSGQYVVTALSREFTVGRLNMHRDGGYGFVIPDHPIEGVQGDVYVARFNRRRDAWRPRGGADRAHRADGRADGEIVKIAPRAHPTVVGEFRVRRRGNFVVPHDDRIQQWIEIPEGMEIPPSNRSVPIAWAPRRSSEERRRSGWHDRQRRDSRISRRWRPRGGTGHRNSWPSRTISASMSRS